MKLKKLQLSHFSLYVTLMLCIVILVILWSGHARINEHLNYHQDVSRITSQKTANEISFYIREQRRLLRLFANRNADQLWHILNQPGDDIAYNETLEELITFFPNLFTYAVATSSGEIKRHDLKTNLGKNCLDDMKDFIQSGKQYIRVHGKSDSYHFDIIARFKNRQKQGILFVGFKTEMISNMLLYAEVPGHTLLLTLPAEDQLIEVTSEGARNVWQRESFQLTEDEKQLILSSADVSNTEWAVIDLQDPELFSDYKHNILVQSNLAIIILVVSGILFMTLNHHEIVRRQKAEAARDEFLSIVSHELRTPLTAISGAITLIKNGIAGKLTEKMSAIIDIAHNNTYRLTSLVNDLLDVQRLENRQMKYKRSLIQPANFIEKAIADIENIKSSSYTSLQFINNADNMLVFADMSRMVQVMDNLISNAIKYGAFNDAIKIELLRDNDYAVIQVTDHGDGIKEDQQNHIFEKFTQTTMTDNRHEKGSGLGLYIAKMIVDYHEGKISYTSSPGNGTTFTVRLPIVTISKKKKTV